jgi:hypothetical protein
MEQESNWNPWAIRYEPLFFAKWQVARKKGVSSLYLSALCDPANGLSIGCRVLRHKLSAAGGDAARALCWRGTAEATRTTPRKFSLRMPRYR